MPNSALSRKFHQLGVDVSRGDVFRPMKRHQRYLSQWADDFICVDVGDTGHPIEKNFPIGTYTIAAGNTCAIYEGAIPLLELPCLAETLKHAVNSELSHHRSRYDPGNLICVCRKIFAWMLQEGIYRFRQPDDSHEMVGWDRDDIDKLLNRVASEGWWEILNYQAVLEGLIGQAEENPEILAELTGRSKDATRMHLNLVNIERRIGLPLAGPEVPKSFVERLAKVAGKAVRSGVSTAGAKKPSAGALSLTAKGLNSLCFLPSEVDSLPFLAVPSINKIVKRYFPNGGGATENLDPESAVKLLNEALKWIYDYSPIVLNLCQLARDKFEEFGHLRARRANAEMNSALSQRVSELQEAGGLPFDWPKAINRTGRRRSPLNLLIDIIQTSALIVIGINHSRRKEELIGERRAFGLYFGCVRPIAEGSNNYRIDVYIEKTEQEFAEFWCNELVVDSVHVLEDISQIFRPLHTSKKEYSADVERARGDKLFISVPFNYASFTAQDRQRYKYVHHAGSFFERAGVAPTVMGGFHPFRRFFAVLYVRRYDHATLQALRQHMRHMSLASLERYIKDPKSRALEKQINTLFAGRVKSLLEEIDIARAEFFEELVERVLRGEEIGGGAGLLIRKTTAFLSKSARFVDLDFSEMAHEVYSRLESEGYRLEEKPPGFCIAGMSGIALRHARCERDGVVHSEEAGAEKCEKCNNNLCTSGNLREHEAEYERLTILANDVRVAPSQRLMAARRATLIFESAKRQAASAKESSTFFRKLAETFHPIVMRGRQ
ncbi:hypothetical protein AWB71_02793 [Caballeronia peredens]|nr:hypothetical protein AWB71_02793 [Caballeronia peredens]